MMDIMYYQIPSLIALNFNKDIQINETEDGKRFEILKNKLPLHFFENTITAKDIVTMIESDSTQFDFSSVNTKGDLNIISFFNTS